MGSDIAIRSLPQSYTCVEERVKALQTYECMHVRFLSFCVFLLILNQDKSRSFSSQEGKFGRQ